MVGPDKPAISGQHCLSLLYVLTCTCTCSSQQGIRITCPSNHPTVYMYIVLVQYMYTCMYTCNLHSHLSAETWGWGWPGAGPGAPLATGPKVLVWCWWVGYPGGGGDCTGKGVTPWPSAIIYWRGREMHTQQLRLTTYCEKDNWRKLWWIELL